LKTPLVSLDLYGLAVHLQKGKKFKLKTAQTVHARIGRLRSIQNFEEPIYSEDTYSRNVILYRVPKLGVDQSLNSTAQIFMIGILPLSGGFNQHI
jgi:hypothetical protein